MLIAKVFLSLPLAALLAPSIHAGTLDRVKTAGTLACGVDYEEPEYTTDDAHGNHAAFDLDLCKAVAVAVLGPGAKFTAVPYRDEADALNGLKKGAVDVVATGSVNYRNMAAGYVFSRTILHDFQGLMVNRASGVQSAKDLAGKKVCFLGGTEIEAQLFGAMKRQNIAFVPFPFQEEGEMEAAFITNNCAAVTADVTQLAYERIAFRGMAREMEILPDALAPDPLALTVREGDSRWAAVVDWVAEALIQAEESGVTQANVAAMRAGAAKSGDPNLERLLGGQAGWGQFLGLGDHWAADVVTAVGNYGELYERTLGAGSPMRLARGANRLASDGGLMQPAPMR